MTTETRGHLTREDQLLLHEHSEAGALCRAYEQLSRTGLAVFVVISAALLALLNGSADALTPIARITLEFVGLIVSVFTLNILWRIRRLYMAYVERVKEGEQRLGMDLHLRWERALKDSSSIPNKIAITGIVGFFCSTSLWRW